MTRTDPEDWSPADNPYAIAVSEAQWWKESARLAIHRMSRNGDDRFGWFSAQQIDARQLVFALRQILSAEQLEQFALKELGIDQAVRNTLTQARQRFEQALPGIKDMRDGLMHFEDWSRGMGKFGPQAKRRNARDLPRDIARDFSGFGFDPNAGTVSFGPYTIHMDVAERAATDLAHSIYLAAREVDKKNTAELRTRTIDALTNAGIRSDTPDAVLKVSPGADLRIWLSLNITTGSEETERRQLSERIVAALANSGLHLESTMQAEPVEPTERLVRSEALYVAQDA